MLSIALISSCSKDDAPCNVNIEGNYYDSDLVQSVSNIEFTKDSVNVYYLGANFDETYPYTIDCNELCIASNCAKYRIEGENIYLEGGEIYIKK